MAHAGIAHGCSVRNLVLDSRERPFYNEFTPALQGDDDDYPIARTESHYSRAHNR